MSQRHHEREAVEKRLVQISVELGFINLTKGQRALLLQEQTALRNAHWQMSILCAERTEAAPSPAPA